MYFVHPQTKFFSTAGLKSILSLLSTDKSPIAVEKIKNLFPQKTIILTDSGRSAFALAIEALSLANSEILAPAYTCDVFLEIFQHYNVKPIFLDLDPNTFNITLQEVARKITPRTKAILISHTYGLANDMPALAALAQKHNLLMIEDCAHALGAQCGNRYLGDFSDAAIFSPAKSLPCLTGGWLLLKSEKEKPALLKNKLSLWQLALFFYSFPLSAFIMEKIKKPAKKILRLTHGFHQPQGPTAFSLGLFNHFFNEFLGQLPHRRKIARQLQQEMLALGFTAPSPQNNVFSYLSFLLPENLASKRDQLINLLNKKHIFCATIWHNPIILQPQAINYYQLAMNDYPQTIAVAQRVINLPLQNYFQEKDVREISQAVEEAVSKLTR